ncbi:TetR family transcriptional regulator [Pseudonocardia spinosispora]|uniref:TetR family transcriptional regulator n=1 Tax=Pseudonocardia spinosispora TaxID=103441 RepID=UPI00040631ED|nr:TetR family transcriptional regulator [Pseudonocardia spinosispora]
MTAAPPKRDGPLTSEEILACTEDVLRRFGPAKATVVDVARALGVSHGTVYRHFPTKSALREAVTHRWLDRVHAGLPDIVTGPGSASDRLRTWLTTLFEAKRRKVSDDPELYATYHVLVTEHSTVIEEHLDDMVDQVRRIIADGAEAGEFHVADAGRSARAVFDALARFHDPTYANHWSRPGIEEAFTTLVDLVLAGLRAD